MDTGRLLGTSAMKVMIVTTALIPAFKVDLRQDYSHPDLFTRFCQSILLKQEWEKRHNGKEMEELVWKNMREQGGLMHWSTSATETPHPAEVYPALPVRLPQDHSSWEVFKLG